MSNPFWLSLLFSALLSGLLVVTAIAIPLRRLRQSSSPWAELFSSLALPLSMLLWSGLCLGLLLAFPAAFGMWQPQAHYRDVWLLFWALLLLFNLSEGIGRLYTSQLRQELPAGRSLLWLSGRMLIVAASLLLVLQFAMDLNAAQLLTSTALLATLVGIALRDVLGNFFAGISINVTGTAQPAQWIAVGDKEGEIIQRNWRETRIRSTGGHIYIIPNSMIAHNLINNMSWHSPLRRHQLDFPLDYALSPAMVLAALREAAHSVAEVDCSYKQPDAMVASCREQCIYYRLRFWSRTFHDRSRIEGLVQERVWYALQRQGLYMGSVLTVQGADVASLSSWQSVRRAPAVDLYQLLQESGFVTRYLCAEQGQLLLTEEMVRQFAGLLRYRLFGPGEELLRLGEQSRSGYIHLRGELLGRTELAEMQAGAGEFRVASGDWVGEITLFSGLPRTATVRAGAGDVELLEVSPAAFAFLLSCHSEVARLFQQRLAERSALLLTELATVEMPLATAVEQQRV
ncbi:mechanosensitive ion channel domain-containing protein [Candidatus Magnetaquicoccus inordinatus]|uniref:mechanosensitive ion channel domain-containing protein n=1 Tax=Candidatus Magnetaquicoccus inordinatus TaxID=2496818 RepID=UPI00102B151A|nr:mechanosensitive ion channel domain-containing protein [Candidatus Magnetaquicoccus inordinatus]